MSVTSQSGFWSHDDLTVITSIISHYENSVISPWHQFEITSHHILIMISSSDLALWQFWYVCGGIVRVMPIYLIRVRSSAVYNYSFIHFLYCFSFAGHGKARANPSWLWVRNMLHPGHVATLSWDSNPEPVCCNATVLTTTPPYSLS